MTEAEVDSALTKFDTEKKKLETVKDQWRMWTKGAGWKDVHQAFLKNRKDFKSNDTISQLKKEVICKHVLTGRIVHTCPTAPCSYVKPLPVPEIGGTLCDVLACKEEEALREKEVMNEMYD